MSSFLIYLNNIKLYYINNSLSFIIKINNIVYYINPNTNIYKLRKYIEKRILSKSIILYNINFRC